MQVLVDLVLAVGSAMAASGYCLPVGTLGGRSLEAGRDAKWTRILAVPLATVEMSDEHIR
jgi:hypothetical protein